MTTEVAKVPTHVLPPGLTQAEAEFVYNTEILGMPVKPAARIAGITLAKAMEAHITQARDIVKNQVRGAAAVTREDVLHGLLDARHRAQLLDRPEVEVMVWDRIIKMEGYDAPKKIDVQVNSTVQVVKASMKTMSDEELLQLAGAQDVIDVDFYEVRK